MSPITTHILDTSRGCPAPGVLVVLEHERGGGWLELGRGTTDADGRAKGLLPADATLQPGDYRLEFETGEYFARDGIATFFRTVVIHFTVTAPGEHYHVPLLLSPFGYSTYRGS
jgi:5-hydroxyisourate hydrolase